MKNYYFILGLNIYATETEIKRAYRKLALQFHPDKNPSPDAEAIFKEINEAYEILSNESTKFNYDQQLRGVSPAAPVAGRAHRDPRYRPRPPGSYSTRTKRQEIIEAMAEYLKYAILMSRVSLMFTLVLMVDYNLDYDISRLEITSTRNLYQSRGGRSVQLQFGDGETLNVNSLTARQFTKGSTILMHKTALFNVPILMENELTHYKTKVPISVYGNFIFAPLILFITSLIGSFFWRGVEFRFNLGVVNFLLMLLTILFLRIHLI